MPSYKKNALEGTHVSFSAESEFYPELFGPTLRKLTDGDNSLRKATKTHTSSAGKRNYHARKPSRRESPPANRQKKPNARMDFSRSVAVLLFIIVAILAISSADPPDKHTQTGYTTSPSPSSPNPTCSLVDISTFDLCFGIAALLAVLGTSGYLAYRLVVAWRALPMLETRLVLLKDGKQKPQKPPAAPKTKAKKGKKGMKGRAKASPDPSGATGAVDGATCAPL